MRLLLDTHVLLWIASGDARLRPLLRATISLAEALYVSSATIYEIEFKMALGKLEDEGYMPVVQRLGCETMPVTADHAREAARLPMLHRDPVDRMLIAQARLERLVLATADRDIRRYDVALL